MSYQFPPFKPWSSKRHCKIFSTAHYLPQNSVTNRDIIEQYNHTVSDAIIERTVGVVSRHIADASSRDTDLLKEAAQICLSTGGVSVENLSKIFVNKFLGDRILPPTASILQRRLGSSVALQCMDIDGGSNSFLQSLDLAAKCIQSGDSHILIASGGICNTLISHTDPRVAFLFGDAATSVLLSHSEEQHILASYFFSNPEYLHLHKGIAFTDIASKYLTPEAEVSQHHNFLTMGNWKESQEYILQAAEVTVTNLLKGAGISIQEVDRFCISELNGPLWKSIINHLGVPPEKTVSTLKDHGNTMSANIPLQFSLAEQVNALKPGSHTLFLSIGEGVSGGGMIYRT